MMKNQEPVMLELAPLPREQIGPFLLLGVDKTAGEEQVQAHWAQRVIRARKNQSRVALGDVHWARQTICDPKKRVQADLLSLNVDSAAGILRNLEQRYGVARDQGPLWQPLDVPEPPAGAAPVAPVPDIREVRAGMTIPDVPAEVPGVRPLLEQFILEPLDPWALTLPTGPSKDPSA